MGGKTYMLMARLAQGVDVGGETYRRMHRFGSIVGDSVELTLFPGLPRALLLALLYSSSPPLLLSSSPPLPKLYVCLSESGGAGTGHITRPHVHYFVLNRLHDHRCRLRDFLLVLLWRLVSSNQIESSQYIFVS